MTKVFSQSLSMLKNSHTRSFAYITPQLHNVSPSHFQKIYPYILFLFKTHLNSRFSLADSQRSLFPQTSFSNYSCHASPATAHGYPITHSFHQLAMLASQAIFRRNLAWLQREPNWTQNVFHEQQKRERGTTVLRTSFDIDPILPCFVI